MSIDTLVGIDNIEALAPISLAELTQTSALMSRVDRKYFVPRAVVADLVAQNAGRARVLEMDGLRTFTYETVYFDHPNFDFYRAHAQGKRHRFKVRVRTYCESGLRMLEVKSKGFRGRTLKERIELPATATATATATAAAAARTGHGPHFSPLEQQFVNRIIGSDSGALEPVLTTVYRRTTLALEDQRVTLDMAMRFQQGDQVFLGPDDVLVETKSLARASSFDAALKTRGIRPAIVSKYQVAASLIYPQLPSNKWNRTLRQYFAA